MEFRSKKIPGEMDSQSTIANSLILQATARKLVLITSNIVSANGNGAASDVYMGIVAAPDKWRVVGVGAWIASGGASTIEESIWWGHLTSDIGGADEDCFGAFVCTPTANKELVYGDILYQGVAPFENFLGIDALENAGEHVWDIGGAGAGVKMGVWQTKMAALRVKKCNVANSTALINPFFLVEYETGGGIT